MRPSSSRATHRPVSSSSAPPRRSDPSKPKRRPNLQRRPSRPSSARSASSFGAHVPPFPLRQAACDRRGELARGVVRPARRGDRRGDTRRGRRHLPGKEPRGRMVRSGAVVNVQRHRLPNGLRIAVAPISGLRSVATLLAVEAGQWFEPAGRPGVARLCAQAMLRGTTKRDAKSWADALDAIGAAARLDVRAHAATFSAQSLGDDVGELLALMAEAVVTPAFAPKEVELVRQQTVAQLEEDSRNTRAVAERVWRGLLFPPAHPLHPRPLCGPPGALAPAAAGAGAPPPRAR